MEQIRARVEERRRREAAERKAAEAEREAAQSAEPARERHVAEPARERVAAPPPSASFTFHGHSIYWSSRGGGVGHLLHASRRLLAPLLKFVFNIDPMVDAIAIQARRNEQQAAFDDDVARRLAAREEQDALNRRAIERLTAAVERLAAELKRQRTLLAAGVKRLDALERARAGEHAARPRDDRQTDERPDDDARRPSSPDQTPPPSDRPEVEHKADTVPVSLPEAESSPVGWEATERPDEDLPASPPAAAPLTPNP